MTQTLNDEQAAVRVAVENHGRRFGHIPDEGCGDIGEFGLDCARVRQAIRENWSKLRKMINASRKAASEKHRKKNKLERQRRKAGRR